MEWSISSQNLNSLFSCFLTVYTLFYLEMNSRYSHFAIKLPLSDQEATKIRNELDYAITFPATGRRIVADFFLLMADQPEYNEVVVQLYAVFMKKIEESYDRMEKIPPEYLALLQSSNFVLLTVNIVFIQTSYNRIHSQHGCLLMNTLFSILQSSTDLLPSLLSVLCHMNVALCASSEDSSLFQTQYISALRNLLVEIYSRYPKQTAVHFKSMYLYYIEMEYQPDSRGAFIVPTVLRQALETTTTSTIAWTSFSTMMSALCVEAVSELALRLSTPLPSSSPSTPPWEVSRLLRAISAVCGAQKLGSLSLISESLLFSKLSAKARIAATKYIARFLTTPSSTDKMKNIEAKSYSRSLQLKTVMTLLDVAMLDGASSLRCEALRVLLASVFFASQEREQEQEQTPPRAVSRAGEAPLVLKLGGKDLLRVAVFKCRDKSSEVRTHAFQLLEQAMPWALLDSDNLQQQQEQPQHTHQLSLQELIAVTKHLLQVYMHDDMTKQTPHVCIVSALSV